MRRIIQIIACIPIVVLFMSRQSWVWTGLLIATTLAGAFYCGYLCPFGLVQELAIDLRKRLKIKTISIPNKLDQFMKSIRYILYIAFAGFSASWVMLMLRFDPRSNLHIILTGKAITLTAVLSTLVFFFAGVYVDRFFCRYLCMKGATYGFLSKFRIVSIVRDTSKCVNCKRCDKVCQMNICVSKMDHVDSMACINCLECVKACPIKNTLEYKPLPTRNIGKRLLLIGVILIAYVSYNQFINAEKTELNVEAIEVIENAESSGNKIENTLEDDNIETQEIEYVVGIGEGYNGEMMVEVAFEDQIIVGIEVLDHQEDYEWYSEAKGPVLEAILEAQSTQVDVVSGATYSSMGIIEAVEDAINNR